MSQFAKVLEELLESKKLGSAAELSRASKVDQATISRVRYGEQSISHEDLDKIARAVDPSPRTHAKLLRAKLCDELRPPGGDLIEIEIIGDRPSKVSEDPVPYISSLPPKLDKAMRILAEGIIKDAELRNIILSLSTLLEKGTL